MIDVATLDECRIWARATVITVRNAAASPAYFSNFQITFYTF
jgi:hypothetical protein